MRGSKAKLIRKYAAAYRLSPAQYRSLKSMAKGLPVTPGMVATAAMAYPAPRSSYRRA